MDLRHAAAAAAAVAGLTAVLSCGSSDKAVAPPPPPPAPTITLTVSPKAPKPGDVLQITAVAVPGAARDSIRRIRILISGVATFADSEFFSAAGAVTLTASPSLPLAVGTVQVTAGAVAGSGQAAEAQNAFVMADSLAPVVSALAFTSLHGATPEPGDTMEVSLDASDSVSLRFIAVHFSGAVSAVDSIAYTSAVPAISRLVRVPVPRTALLNDTLRISVTAGNVGGVEATQTLGAPAVVVEDQTPPAISASFEGFRLTFLWLVGDTLTIHLTATDNVGVRRVGYQLGSPAGLTDSVSISGDSVDQVFSIPLQQSWIGDVPLTLFAVDAAGNRNVQPRGNISVQDSAGPAARIRGVRIDGGIIGMAYDPVRKRLYVSESATKRVDAVDVDPSHGAPAVVASYNTLTWAKDLDVTPSGDTVITATRSGSLNLVDVTTGAVDTLHVIDPGLYGEATYFVRVVGGDRAIFFAEAVGATDSVLVQQVDLRSGSLVPEDSGRGIVGLSIGGLIERTADRHRLYALIGTGCCIEVQFYDDASQRFTTGLTTTYPVQWLTVDAAGDRLLAGVRVVDSTFSLLKVLQPLGPYYYGVSAISADGAYAFLPQQFAVIQVRIADDSVVTTYPINSGVSGMEVSPDGTQLFVNAGLDLFVIDLR